VKKATDKESLEHGSFSKFVGILDNDFTSDDVKYNEIVK